MRRALVLGLLVLVPGCLAPDVAPPQGPEVADRHAYFTAEMTLEEAVAGDVSGVRAGSFFQAWAEGDDYPTWRAAPASRDVAVEEVNVTLVVRATGPVARTFRFPDLMVYAGSGDAWMSINTTQTDPILLPGEQYRFAFPIPTPAGGLWIPAGESFGLKVVPVMHQNDQADVEVLVGAETASQATWRERAVDAAVVTSWTPGSEAGELVGSAYAGAAAPQSTRHRAVVEVPLNATVLLAWMNTTSNEGVPDLDLEVVSPGGESLVFSGTPTPREMVRLAAFNMEGPGAYTLVAHNYGSARARFTLEWAVGS